MPRLAALGFRSHSGWATLVALAGPASDPRVVVRRRIELARKSPRQPYHAAEGRPLREAQRLVRRVESEAAALAERALGETIRGLKLSGHRCAGSGLLLASGRALPELEVILASHALVHAAEGELYREAIRAACRAYRIPVTGVRERELETRAAHGVGLPAQAMKSRVAGWGRELGPPWRQDEKLAALVAWLALT